MSIAIFGFQALWSPYYLTILVMVTSGYFWLLASYRQKNTAYVVTKRQAVYFFIAMFLLYVVKGSPVDLLSHIMFSAHMIQMALLYFVIAPLCMLAIPTWLWSEMLACQGMRSVLVSLLSKPLLALVVFNSLFSLYHIPLVFDFIKTNMWLHAGYTSLLFIAAIWMWLPLIQPLSQQGMLSGVKKVAYIFGSGMLLTPACALIIFANEPMYSTFTNPDSWAHALRLCVPTSTLSSLNLSGPEMFSGLPALEDQQLGGVLMKITQEIVLGYVLGVVFFAWFKQENAIDPMPTEWEITK